MAMVDNKDRFKPNEPLKFQGSIRNLREKDLLALKPILETWVKNRDTGLLIPEEVEEDLQLMSDSVDGSDRTYFVAEDQNGEVIGVIGYKKPDDKMLEFTSTPNPAELVNAYVKIDERKGKGVGRALVAKLEESAKDMGFTEIVLNSGPRYEKTGWGFYDKLPGYKRVGVAVKLYGEGGDAPVWTKIL